MRIIPAIDIIDGKCVRLTQGDYNQKKIYNEDPLEVAKSFEQVGITSLHLVDLDGAKSGHIINTKVLESIAKNTSLNIDFGGGVKTEEDIKLAFSSGATQVTCGSIAVKDPDSVHNWGDNFGHNKIIIGADVKDEKIAISGWKKTTKHHIEDFLEQYLSSGFTYVICTDIATDGMLQGPNFKLYEQLLMAFPHVKLIASGGISSTDDLNQLKKIGVEGAIIGKAIYENKISLEDLKNYSDA